MDRRLLIVFIFVLVIGAVAAFNVTLKTLGNAVLIVKTCNDGTFYNECSSSKEFFCDNGQLISSCGRCECGDGYSCIDNKCEQVESCESGNGICSNSCENGYIEYYPLTSSCNTQENYDGSIDISNSRIISINAMVENLNNYRILDNINVNAFIEDTEINDGFTLLSLYPNDEHEQTLILEIPDTLDKSKQYILKTEVRYNDKTFEQGYLISVSGGLFTLVIQNFTFSYNEIIRIGNDLDVHFEIVNKKCCMKNKANINRFFGYCSNEGECLSNRPMTCKNGIYVEDCGKCGCDDKYKCNPDGKCSHKLTDQEIKNFFELNELDSNEIAIIGDFVKDFSRIPRTVEKVDVSVEKNKLNIKIKDVNISGTLKDGKVPNLNIDLGIN